MPGKTTEDVSAIHVGSGTLKRLLTKLITDGFLAYTIPDKPNSSAQKYKATRRAVDYIDRTNMS